ncbi:MAG TPA: hypothetical protein VLJ11_00480 [Bryobacteraceae bacterium]|nr:hypothetical protein [Bryobacteraceae bacterium]
MLPDQLKPEDFKAYPPEARQRCVARIALLRQLPLAFVPLLLREVIAYDWRFPVERHDLDAQLAYLAAMSPEELHRAMLPFSGLRLSGKLEAADWVSSPAQFSEQLTAHLWATHQVDTFRAAAVEYVDKFNAAKPKITPEVPRLGIIMIGQGVTGNTYPLFMKLRRQGVYFSNVDPANGRQAIFETVTKRAAAHPIPFAHWYIDGGDTQPAGRGLTCVSYNALGPVRDALLARMQRVMQQGGGGPELLRTELAGMRPEDVGMAEFGGNPVLNRFQLSLLTEGSGTQIYSTTFVQWSAREALRRAEPLTLLARFAPRRREQSMSELISGVADQPGIDPQGSLIDADMAAYYTWLNQQRLSGADKSSFLVWFEAGREAVAVGPSMPREAQQNRPIDIPGILRQLT